MVQLRSTLPVGALVIAHCIPGQIGTVYVLFFVMLFTDAPCTRGSNSRKILASMTYFDHLCTTVSMFSCELLQKTLTDGPTSGTWSKLLVGSISGMLVILRVLAVLRGSVPRMLSVLQAFRGSILRVLPVLGVMYCSYSPYFQYLL